MAKNYITKISGDNVDVKIITTPLKVTLVQKPIKTAVAQQVFKTNIVTQPITTKTAITAFKTSLESSNYVVKLSRVGRQGVKGDVGADGEQGIQGIKGDIGSQGEMGIKGNTGDQGATGAMGTQGNKGDQGTKGDIGDQGAKGTTGSTGSTGSVGAKGDDGSTGATGTQGSEGSQGETGAQGGKGDTGNTGSTGSTGSQGTKGDTGSQGETGSKGDTGNKGSQGSKGDTGEQGSTGSTGGQGIQGVKGDKGDTGDKGTTGSTGSTGAKGDTGTGVSNVFNDTSNVAALLGVDFTVDSNSEVTGTVDAGSFLIKDTQIPGLIARDAELEAKLLEKQDVISSVNAEGIRTALNVQDGADVTPDWVPASDPNYLDESDGDSLYVKLLDQVTEEEFGVPTDLNVTDNVLYITRGDTKFGNGVTFPAGGGSIVTPNPTGTDGSQLNRIEIDGINFNIPAGGGSGGTNVQPNPTGTEGTDLTRIQIAGNDFNIPVITTEQADEITVNTLKVGITTEQADEIDVNTLKVGITTEQADEIDVNTLKVGITTEQAAEIVVNNAKANVEPNPSGTDGVTLDRLSIGGTNFNIPSGGSGTGGATPAQIAAIALNTAKVTNATTWSDYALSGLFNSTSTETNGTLTIKLQFGGADNFVFRNVVKTPTYTDTIYSEEALTTVLATRGG